MYFISKVFQELQAILKKKNTDKISGCTNYFLSTKIQVHSMMPPWLGVCQKFDFSVMINNSTKKNCDDMLIFLPCQNEVTPSL